MKWLIMWMVLVLVAGFFNGIMEIDYTHGEVNKFSGFIDNIEGVTFSINIISTGISLLKVGMSALVIFWQFLVWDYAFFAGGWWMVRIIFIGLTTAPFIVLIGLRKLGAQPE